MSKAHLHSADRQGQMKAFRLGKGAGFLRLVFAGDSTVRCSEHYLERRCSLIILFLFCHLWRSYSSFLFFCHSKNNVLIRAFDFNPEQLVANYIIHQAASWQHTQPGLKKSTNCMCLWQCHQCRGPQANIWSSGASAINNELTFFWKSLLLFPGSLSLSLSLSLNCAYFTTVKYKEKFSLKNS